MKPVIERILEKTTEDPETGCWNCSLSLSRGYPQIKVDREVKKVHRIIYEYFFDTIPKGLEVCHDCDNKRCVNPWHLWLGTTQDNTADRHAKGRDAKGDRHFSRTKPERLARGDRNGSRTHPEKLPRGKNHWSHIYPERRTVGERNRHAKLVDWDIRFIRYWNSIGFSRQEISKSFGVKLKTIKHILEGKSWNHVT